MRFTFAITFGRKSSTSRQIPVITTDLFAEKTGGMQPSTACKLVSNVETRGTSPTRCDPMRKRAIVASTTSVAVPSPLFVHKEGNERDQNAALEAHRPRVIRANTLPS
mmetsp:Transcript_86/g.181  ORF Transcript_86/g.181 Transcript_86/m.181 type:complete len:108 (+) Transcript_86:1043-1366(+)